MKGENATAWLAPYPLLKNNQTTAGQLQECLQREMPPVSLGYSSCYDERAYGATSGLAFVEVMGAQMWVWRLELEVPLVPLPATRKVSSGAMPGYGKAWERKACWRLLSIPKRLWYKSWLYCFG